MVCVIQSMLMLVRSAAALATMRPVLLESVDDDDVYNYIRWRLKLEGETENKGVCTKERKGVTAQIIMATPCTTLIQVHWQVKVGGTGMKDVGGAVLAGSSPPLRGRERAAVDVDVGPERKTLVCIRKTATRHKRVK